MNRPGFTVLELIVVIIIIGVLSALAIPRYNAMMQKVTAAEALRIMKSVSDSIQRCLLMSENDNWHCASAASWQYLDVEWPDLDPNGKFTYTLLPEIGPTEYQITATSRANFADSIRLKKIKNAGFSIQGSGVFEGWYQ